VAQRAPRLQGGHVGRVRRDDEPVQLVDRELRLLRHDVIRFGRCAARVAHLAS
jgi:hypothetical protein